jgi:hypothetical protein
MPLIVHGKIVEIPFEEANFWKGGTTQVDVFNYYKSKAIIIGTIVAVLTFFGLIFDKKINIQKEKRYYIPILIYMIVSILSAIMSQFKGAAFNGFIEMHQGLFVLMSYMVLLFIMINFIVSENDVKVLIYSFVVLIFIEGVIGLSQYFGFDILQSPLGLRIIAPSFLNTQDFKFSIGAYNIYGTLFNPNFVGSLTALLLPISITLYLFENDKKKSVSFGIAAVLAYILWIGCKSRAGYLGISAASIIGIFVFKDSIKTSYKKLALLLIIFLVIFIILNLVSNGSVFNQFLRLLPSTETESIEEVKSSQQVLFNDVSIDKNILTIKTNKETFYAIANNGALSFYDSDNNPLGLTRDNDGKAAFVDEHYSNYKLQVQPSVIRLSAYDRKLDLYVTEESEIKVISFNNNHTVPVEAPRLKLFDGKEAFASYRGYIWSRTIPMLKDTIIVGYGPDNYPMYFPQEDYVGRFNASPNGLADTVIDKPHNLYLQTAINTGVVSLISLLLIWGTYLIDSFKLYIKKNLDSFVDYIGAAIFLSIIAYLVAGIFNDSVVSVAPLFWVLLGMGISINRTVRYRS